MLVEICILILPKITERTLLKIFFSNIFPVIVFEISPRIHSINTPTIPPKIYPERFKCIYSGTTSEIIQEIVLCLCVCQLFIQNILLQKFLLRMPLGFVSRLLQKYFQKSFTRVSQGLWDFLWVSLQHFPENMRESFHIFQSELFQFLHAFL